MPVVLARHLVVYLKECHTWQSCRSPGRHHGSRVSPNGCGEVISPWQLLEFVIFQSKKLEDQKIAS